MLQDLREQAMATADWRRVASLWEQCAEILRSGGDGAYLPESLTGQLARAMGHVFASYDDAEDGYVMHLLAVMAFAERRAGAIDQLFRDLYFDDQFAHERYQPTDGRRVRSSR